MARPLRRVLIGLSIRLQRPLHELERLSVATIREYLAMLAEINAPPKRPGDPPEDQSPEEMKAAFKAAIRLH